MRFKDKSILITGSSGGIGGETALCFAGHGDTVALIIADAIIFLSSDEASYITSAILQVDVGTRLLV